MWQEVDYSEWVRITQLNNLPVFFNIDLLKSLSKSASSKLILKVAKKNDSVLAVAALHVISKRIIRPDDLFYSALWNADNIREEHYFQIWEDLFNELTVVYKKISFKLGPWFTDLRPFIWNGFKTELKYTQIKKVPLSVTDVVSKKASILINVQSLCQSVSSNDIDINVDFFFDYSGGQADKVFYRNFLSLLSHTDIIKSFNLYRNEIKICSSIIVVDVLQKNVYCLLTKRLVDEKHIYAKKYIDLFNWCIENGYRKVDLGGANTRGISVFKSQFDTDLQPYFKVTYSSSILKFANNLKRKLIP